MKYIATAVAALHVVDGLPRPGSKVGFPEMMYKHMQGTHLEECIGFPGLDYDSHFDVCFQLSLLLQSNITHSNFFFHYMLKLQR